MTDKPRRRKSRAKTKCKVCEQMVADVVKHANGVHGMSEDEYARYDPTPLYQAPIIRASRKAVVTADPPPEESTIEMRLVEGPGNPFSCSVEGRRGTVYHFNQDEGWKKVPAPDAYILLGGEGIPPKYPHLTFEKRR